VQSPQPRKRKLNTEGKEESVAKRRYAQNIFLSCSVHFFLALSTVYIRDIVADMCSPIGLQIGTTDGEGLLNRVFRVLEQRIR
jgi:hypothetical protein